MLCCSDANPLSMRELLELADDDAKARWEALTLGYTESAGTPALREEIARCCVLLLPTGQPCMCRLLS